MKKFKILIVEDEQMLLDLMEMFISAEINCEITTASNGKDAMDFLSKDGDFQLIISDYKMPKATGGDLYRFNSTLHNHPFFLFSGGDLDDYPELDGFQETNPNNRFFSKPFSDKKMLIEIKRIYDLKS